MSMRMTDERLKSGITDPFLIRIRREWEPPSLEYLGSIDLKGVFLVVLNDENGLRCHRYFLIGNRWDVSVDHQQANLETTISWLSKMITEFSKLDTTSTK